MSLTCQEFKDQGFLDVIIELFQDGPSVGALLQKAQIGLKDFEPFGSATISVWWNDVCKKLAHGIAGGDGLERLLRAAADTYPGHRVLKEYRSSESEPDKRENKGGNITLKFPDNYSPEDVLKILDRVEKMAMVTGNSVDINFGQRGSSQFSLSITGIKSQEEVEQLTRRIERELAEEGYQGRVEVEPYHFRDYYSDPLTAEGPDGQRFALDRIRASTRVKDLARGIMHQYSDEVWPSRKGQKTQAVVDHVTAEGKSNRLDPRETLHDAGVRPGDTLRVAPERTAGAIDPAMRDAALARARNEVLRFAESRPGFEAEANSLVAPTEFVFYFKTPGFAPPPAPGAPPRRIMQHEVLIELPDDFPVKAPNAWWQTDIFHPNIDPKTGWVCLGALQEQYRPSLDFGELCQMLFDLAGFRNYAITEGHNAEAAKWALSKEGQKAVEEIGGLSVIARMVDVGDPEPKLRIRKIES